MNQAALTTVPTSHCCRKRVGKLVDILCLSSFHILMPFEDDLHSTLSQEVLMNFTGDFNWDKPQLIYHCSCKRLGISKCTVKKCQLRSQGTEGSIAWRPPGIQGLCDRTLSCGPNDGQPRKTRSLSPQLPSYPHQLHTSKMCGLFSTINPGCPASEDVKCRFPFSLS